MEKENLKLNKKYIKSIQMSFLEIDSVIMKKKSQANFIKIKRRNLIKL